MSNSTTVGATDMAALQQAIDDISNRLEHLGARERTARQPGGLRALFRQHPMALTAVCVIVVAACIIIAIWLLRRR